MSAAELNRRRFALGLLSTAGFAGAGRVMAATPLASAGDGAAMPGTVATAACENPAASFAAAARSGERWTAGYAGIAGDQAPLAMTVRGKLPPALVGSFYRNGAARHELGGKRYAHWFDGDGAIQRYELGPRGISHSARFVRTEKFVADSAAGRPVRQAFGTRWPEAEPLRSADAINAANIHVVQHAGRLLALWEGGSAIEIDPKTLATRGPNRWADDLAGMPFSAHPRIEPDGTMWNFGVSSLPSLLTLYRIGADGRLRQHHTLRVPDLPMVHDFAVTERHLVFLLPPLVFDAERLRDGASFLASYVWRPELGLRVMVLDKARLDAAPRWFTLPPGFVFHLGNACEEGGVLRLDCMRSASPWQVLQGAQDLMCGIYRPQDHTQAMLVELDLGSGRAQQEVLAPAAEFPRVDPRHIGRSYRQVFAASRLGFAHRPGYDAVMRMDLKGGTIDRFHYGDEVQVEEHVFVPRAGAGEGEGWLLGSALDLARGQTLFSVFDAKQLAAGPVLQARMPRIMPIGLHASFVPA